MREQHWIDPVPYKYQTCTVGSSKTFGSNDQSYTTRLKELDKYSFSDKIYDLKLRNVQFEVFLI